MADRDNIFIDIFSNEDDFSFEGSSTRKVSEYNPGSGLMMVSGYGTDGSESKSSIENRENSKEVEDIEVEFHSQEESQSVPMELEELEEGEYLSDFNPEDELERLLETDTGRRRSSGGNSEEQGVENGAELKFKKKDKKHKKKKKKHKDGEKKDKKEKRQELLEKEPSKDSRGSRSQSKENKPKRKDVSGESREHAEKRHRKDGVDEKRKDTSNHRERRKSERSVEEKTPKSSNQDEKRDWSKVSANRSGDRRRVEAAASSSKHPERSVSDSRKKHSKDHYEGSHHDRSRQHRDAKPHHEVDEASEPRWERRVKVIDKVDEHDNDHRRKPRHTITVAIDQKPAHSKLKHEKNKSHEKKEKKRSSGDLRHSKRDRSQSLASSEEGNMVIVQNKEKKKEKREKQNAERERKSRDDRKKSDSVMVDDEEKQMSKKKAKKSRSKSIERKKDKKKKKKKKMSKRSKHQSESRSSAVSGSRSHRTDATKPNEDVERHEKEKDLDLEMKKDREFNTLDQRLEEIERRMAMDTDISSDESEDKIDAGFHDDLDGNLVISTELESREEDNKHDFAETLGTFGEDNEDGFKMNFSDDLKSDNLDIFNEDVPLHSIVPDLDEEELSGEALFMKEYGIELEEKSEGEEQPMVTEPLQAEGLSTQLQLDEIPVSFGWKTDSSENQDGLGFFNKVDNDSIDLINKDEQELHETSESLAEIDSWVEEKPKPWNSIDTPEGLEAISDDEIPDVSFGSPSQTQVKDDVLQDSSALGLNDLNDDMPWDQNVISHIENEPLGLSENLEEISDQEDIFDSIEKETAWNEDEEEKLRDDDDILSLKKSDSVDIGNEPGDLSASKWKPVGVTEVMALSKKLLSTPSDEYCEFGEKDTEEAGVDHVSKEKGRRRKRSSSRREELHHHKREHKAEHRSTEKSSEGEKGKHLSEQDGVSGEGHGITKTPSSSEDAHVKVKKFERTADKYKKKPAKRSLDKATQDKDVSHHQDKRRRSRSKEMDDDKHSQKHPEGKRTTSGHEMETEGETKGDIDSEQAKPVEQEKEDHFTDAAETQRTDVHEKVSAEHAAADHANKIENHEHNKHGIECHIVEQEQGQEEASDQVKGHETKLDRSKDIVAKGQETALTKKKRRKESSRKSKDDLFDDIFGKSDGAEEGKDDFAHLLKDPETFKKVPSEFSPKKGLDKEGRKERHHKKKTEESKQHRKKEARRKRESESNTQAGAGGKTSKVETRANLGNTERIPGIMDEDDMLKHTEKKDTSLDISSTGIPLLFDSLPKVEILRSNSEEKENDQSSLHKGLGGALKENIFQTESQFEDLSPYNPEELTPIDMNESSKDDSSLKEDSIAAAIESIEKKRETIFANLNFETILREKAREQARQHKADMKESKKDLASNEPQKDQEGMVDYLIRQSRVEDEMKTVLKEYFRKKEISKEEYKAILKKAVPQVTMSNSPIIPEKIRSLMRKFVCKTKGQRILNSQEPKKSNGLSKKETFKKYKPPKLPEPKPKGSRELNRKSGTVSSGSGQGTQLKILNPNLPLPPVL